MAEKFIRTGSDGSATTTVAIDTSFAVAVGDLVVVMVTGQEGGTISGVADTATNSYTPCTASNTFTLAQIFWTKATSAHASNIVTATFSGAVRYKVIAVAVHDGMDASPFIAEAVGNTGGGTLVTSASMNTTGSVPLLFWVSVASNDRSWTPGGGGTEIYDSFVPLGFGSHGSAWLAPGAGGSYTVSSTADAASNLDLAAAAFKTSSGGAPRSLLLMGVG